MTLVASSCTDVLDQMPTTEDTSKEVYADAANYKKVLAKIYASYVLAGQGQGGDNGDLKSINKQDFSQGPKVDENTPVIGYIPEAYDGIGMFDFIESELKELVAEGVSSALPATNEYGRASKPVAWALLARLYLNSAIYRGNVDTKYYTECITACKQVISNPAFYLEPEYAKLFNADNHKRTHEILFAMVCDATTSVTWGGGTYIICGSCGNSSTQDPAKYGLSNGWGMFRARGEMTAKFGDIATTKDSRAMFYTDGQAQFFTGAIDNQAEGYFFEKFSNLTDEGVAASNSAATGCSTDYPLLRLADIYLMAAEAQLRGGTGLSRAEALELVNQVRLRAYNQLSLIHI